MKSDSLDGFIHRERSIAGKLTTLSAAKAYAEICFAR